MIAAVGKYDLHWFHPKAEVQQWAHTLKAYLADELVMVPTQPDIGCDAKVRFRQATDIGEALALFPGVPKIFLEDHQHRGMPLDHFRHPANAVYVFGSNCSGNTDFHHLADAIVTVQTPDVCQLWAGVVLGIVLEHRRVQWR